MNLPRIYCQKFEKRYLIDGKLRGLRIDLCVSPPETGSEEDEAKLPEPVDEGLAETEREYNNLIVDKSEPKNPHGQRAMAEGQRSR